MAHSDDRLDRRVAAAKWLRETRERRGYATAGQFASALGIERYQLSNWETGRSSIDDEQAELIARVLNMDIIEVRRGLGLWVPDDAQSKSSDDSSQPSATDPLAIINNLQQQLNELRAQIADQGEGEDSRGETA